MVIEVEVVIMGSAWLLHHDFDLPHGQAPKGLFLGLSRLIAEILKWLSP